MAAREDIGHREEILNLRSFYGRLLRKIWLIPAALVIGAAVGLFLYYLVNVVYAPAREYEASSKLYLNFAYDESGKVYDYYNAYTWNQLMSTDEILNATMDALKADGIAELAAGSETEGSMTSVSRDEVIASTKATIPSDVRVMEVTITNTDKDLAQEILKATDKALVAYGENRDEFTSIELLEEDDTAALEVTTSRTLTAGITGAVTAAVLMLLAMLILGTMDDAIYVPEDPERRYHLPVLGMLPKKEQELTERFRNELLAGCRELVQEQSRVCVISLHDRKGKDFAERDVQDLKEQLKSGFDFQKTTFLPTPVPGADLEAYRLIHDCDGVVLSLCAGDKNGSITEHTISQLHKHNCPILGILMTDVDVKFINWYYRIKE